MAEVTRNEFAAICNVAVNLINTYVGRKKINVLPNKLIDTEDVLNKIFSQNRKKLAIKKKGESKKIVSKKTTPDKPEPKNRKTRAQKKEEEFIDNLSLRKLTADTEKSERDNELKKIQLEKMMGKLIPVDLVHGILKINVQNVFISFENELINLASIYCDIMAGGDRSKLSEIIDLMRQNLHRIISETKNNAAKEIEGVINEYSETRSRGEKK